MLEDGKTSHNHRLGKLLCCQKTVCRFSGISIKILKPLSTKIGEHLKIYMEMQKNLDNKMTVNKNSTARGIIISDLKSFCNKNKMMLAET